MQWVHKRTLPIPALTIADPALIVGYRYWSERKDGAHLPPRCAVDTPIFRLVVADHTWLTADSYTGRLTPYLAATSANAAAAPLEEPLNRDLKNVFTTGVPSLQLIELKVKGASITYQQLLLPTADDGDHVTEVLEISRLGALRLVRSGKAAA